MLGLDCVIALLLRRVPALRLSSSHDDGTLVLCHVMEHEGWMCRESGFPMERDAVESAGKHNFCGCGAYVELGGRPQPPPARRGTLLGIDQAG